MLQCIFDDRTMHFFLLNTRALYGVVSSKIIGLSRAMSNGAEKSSKWLKSHTKSGYDIKQERAESRKDITHERAHKAERRYFCERYARMWD